MEADMLLVTALSAFISAILIILYKILSNSHSKSSNNLPPSPPGSLPILGHLLLFKTVIHRALHDFSQNFGPIFSVRLGPRLVVVVSSSELVHECFTKNDIVLANRPQPAVDRRSLGFSSTTVIGAQYGTHWRNLRKLCDLEVFAPTCLASFLSIRRDEMDRTISSLYRISSSVVGFAKVNVEAKIVELTFNNIMRMLVGKRYYGTEEAEDDEESKKFKELTKEALLLTDPSNIEEIFPMLRWIGCNRLEKKLATHSRKTDEFMTRLLDQHRRGVDRRDNHNMVVDNLLSLQESQPEYYTDEIIMDLIVAIVIAGTDASVVTTEWAMSLLLNHPDVLMKARQELDTLVGHDRLVQEHDLPELRYLHFIVLETLRLFPSVPTLVPHAPSQDCEIGGYNIPKNTMIIINAWAVQRDPKVWDDPLSFKPERFEKIELETHKFLPFGMGRRACPGAGLAQKLVGLALGSFIQCFDWERPSLDKIDLSEGSGTVLHKTKPLEAMCRARNVMEKVLQQISKA